MKTVQFVGLIWFQEDTEMSKLKSIMENWTKGNLGGGQGKSCYDCLHVMPGLTGDEVTCEIYTFKNERFGVPHMGGVPPNFAIRCEFYEEMDADQKATSEMKFKEFYKKLGEE
jgi:hypothetical protein